VLYPAIVIAGALFARARLHFNLSLLETIRHPIPAELLFPGSARAWEAGVLFATLGLATAGYAAIVHDAHAIPRRALVLSTSLAAVAALGWPLVYSADTFAYAAYGIEVLRGIDPYAAPITTAVHVPRLIEDVRAWSGTIPRDLAGPLFTALCAAAAAIGQPVSLLRIVAVAAFVACVRFWPADDPRGAAFFAAHPVIAWSAAEGHNDVVAFALVVLAWRIAGPAGLLLRVAAVLTKAFAIVPLVVELAELERGRRLISAGIAVLIGIAYMPIVAALPVDLAHGGPRELQFSALGLAALGTAPPALRVLGFALAAGLVAICIARRAEGEPALALAAWALFPTAYPWWCVWLIAVVARNRPSASWAALLAASFASMASYLPPIRYGPHIPAMAGNEIAFAGSMLALIYAIPLLVLATAQRTGARSLAGLPLTASTS
jgi:hypothetical protein